MDDDTLSHSDVMGGAARAEGAAGELPDLTGQVLDGRFRVETRLGRGGMGAVYRATQIGVTERPVAVKVILPERVGGTDALARFEREARAAARLSHPNTLRVFEFGRTTDGLPYLVTELLQGRSLADELARVGRLPVARALHVAIQALASLSEAHQQGIVHRDLKPDNLFLADVVGASDFVKVIDFGLATVPGDTDQRLTAAGQTLGTPAYMSPEQVHGKVVGASSDIYSMGVILFEMVSGRRPFSGNTPFDTMRAQVMDPVPPLDIDGGYTPPELAEVVARCLEKRPEHRPSSADELRRRLGDVLAGVTSASGPPPMTGAAARVPDDSPGPSSELTVPRRPVLPWVVAAVAAVALVVWRPWAPSAPAPQATPAVAALTSEPPSSAPTGHPAPLPAVREPRTDRLPESWEPLGRHDVWPVVGVLVESAPLGATVLAGGAPLGATPFTVWLPEGASRQVELRRAGHRPASLVVEGRDGEPPAPVRLRPASSALDVRDFAPSGEERLLDRLGKP